MFIFISVNIYLSKNGALIFKGDSFSHCLFFFTSICRLKFLRDRVESVLW